jgi:hypothetical protein
VRLSQLISATPDTWESFKAVESAVYDYKIRFYDQFLPALS